MSDVLYEGWMILAALLPSIGLLYLFFVIIKHMIEGDRRERAAQRELDQHDRPAEEESAR
jgi:hypothetical protein